jgi:hypothetical protein
MLALLLTYIFLRLVPSDREASMDSIRQDLGTCLAQGRYQPC